MALADKLAARGLPAGTQTDLVEGLFADGVSTADEISQTSGRGVGMSALRQTVGDLGGSIRVSSARGLGTTIACHFPEAHAEIRRRVAAFGSIQPSITPQQSGSGTRLRADVTLVPTAGSRKVELG